MVIFMLDLKVRFVDHTTGEFIVAMLSGRELEKLIMDHLTSRGDVHPCFRVRGPCYGGGSHSRGEQQPLLCGPE